MRNFFLILQIPKKFPKDSLNFPDALITSAKLKIKFAKVAILKFRRREILSWTI